MPATDNPSVKPLTIEALLKKAAKWDGSTPIPAVYNSLKNETGWFTSVKLNSLKQYGLTYPVLSLEAAMIFRQVSEGKIPYDRMFDTGFLAAVKSQGASLVNRCLYYSIRFDVFQGANFTAQGLAHTEPAFKVGDMTWSIEYEDLQTMPSYRNGAEPLDPNLVEAIAALNYLGRPPLTDEEILLMTNEEVIETYYSLREIVDVCKIKPHAVLSNGMYKRYVPAYEKKLQERIYSLRGDLHQVTDVDGKQYRALIEPRYLNPPDCQVTTGMPLVLLAASFIPFVGLAVSAYSAAMQIKGSIDAAAMAKKYGVLATEIGIGIGRAKTLPSQPAHPELVEALRIKYVQWTQLRTRLGPHFEDLWNLVPTIYGAQRILGSERIVGNGQQYIRGGMQEVNYKFSGTREMAASHWQLADFFYSKHVRQLITGQSEGIAGEDIGLVEAGIGLGALVLLLL